jgi:hypothetical protein
MISSACQVAMLRGRGTDHAADLWASRKKIGDKSSRPKRIPGLGQKVDEWLRVLELSLAQLE